MSQVAEKQSFHSIASELQPWHYSAFIALGFLAFNPGKWPFVVVVLGFGYYVWAASEKKREARENAARLSGIVNLCAPIVVPSLWITEPVDELAKRAEQIRKDLQDSGNPYAAIIPVIEFPYSPMLFQVGQLALAWPMYQRLVGEKIHTENIVFFETKCPAHLKAIFASQVLPAPKQTIEN
jgi:hypothetical protein